MILLDTDVMVDVLRGHVPARDWLASVTLQEIGIPGLVAMELLQGCRDAREQRRVEKTLGTYPLCWPSGEDCAKALTWFAAYRLSHQLGMLDALIAAAATGLRAELATFNTKHYGAVKQLKTIQPYRR